MELTTAIKERRSIRKFEDKPVERELIKEIVEVARFAPSWKNTQIARYIVVEDKATIEKLSSEECVLGFKYNTKTMKNSPVMVIETYKTGRCGYEKDGSFTTPKKDGWEMFDAGIAAQSFCLAAHERGLGTVIMGIFDEKEVAKVVDIPEGQKVGAIICMGYPAISPDTPPRKEVDELVTFAD